MKKFLFLLLSAVCALLYAPPANAWTAYLQMSSTPSQTPRIWAWDANDKSCVGTDDWASRPAMTAQGNNLYSYTGTGTPANIKFTIGNIESNNCAFVDGITYKWGGESGYGLSGTYDANYTIYVKNNSSQTNLYAYIWDAAGYTPGNLNNWAANDDVKVTAATEVESNTYKFEFSLTVDVSKTPQLKFHNGNNGWETSNAVTPTDGNLYTIGSNATTTDNGTFVPSADVYMPLTEDDFNDGPRYFLVGVRTADWRLQPEWELHVNADRSQATLSGRLMYQQWFGVAKVDTYNDYIHHRYTLYGNNTTPQIKNGNSGNTYDINYSTSSRASDYTSDGGSGQGAHSVSNMFMWFGERNDWDAVSWSQTSPSLLENVTLKLSGDTPTQITFDFTQDADKVGAVRTISLTGENIKYNDMFTFNDGIERDLATMTSGSHLDRFDGDVSDRWGNAWVQYDVNGRPYVDGNGDLLYNTAFDFDWLSGHHVRFYNKEKDLEYTSYNTVFLPADQISESEEEFQKLYLMHPLKNGIGYNRIGNNEERNISPLLYKEAFDNDFKDGREYIDNSSWQCYVVKDMWLDGEFKLWTGWGGNMKIYNDVSDGVYDTAEQWFYENGGHQTINYSRVVRGFDVTTNGGTVTVYPTRRDREQANFKIDGMTYYSRVILWYNPDYGFENSVLQLVRAQFGPNIQAFHNPDKRNTLRYEWWIDSQDESNDGVNVTGYEVKRYKIEGTELLDETVVETSPGNSANYHNVGYFKDSDGNAINKIGFKDDSKTIPAGQYLYKIWVTFDNGTTKQATSNIVSINEVATPVDLTAEQQMDGQNRYTFNAEVNAAPNPEQAARTVTESTTVKDMMKWYILVTDDATKTRLDKATSLTVGGTEATVSTFWTLSDGTNAQIGQNEYVGSGLWFHKFEIPESDRDDLATLAMPTLVWHNVYPTRSEAANGRLYKLGTIQDNEGNYTNVFNEADNSELSFTAYLTCNDNATDFAAWDLMNFNAAQASTPIVAPTAAITLGTPYLQKSDFKAEFTMLPAISHPDGGRLSNLYKEDIYYPEHHAAGEHNEEEGPLADDPVHYDAFNESVAPLTVDALPVADEVISNWNIGYDISVRPSSVEYDAANVKGKHRISTLYSYNINTQKELDVNAYDIDLSEIQTMESLDGRHSGYIDGTKASMEFQSHLQVRYEQKGKYGNELVNLDSEPSENTLKLGYTPPAVSQKGSAFAKYKAQYFGEDVAGIEGLHTIDYLAHAVVGFDISGYSDIDLYPYIAFDAQQKLYYCELHKGVYKEPHAPYYLHTDCQGYGITDPLNWKRLSFAGTRAANGGHPVNSGWDASVTNIVPALSCRDDETGATVEYTDFSEYIDGSAACPWEPQYNWSRIAARAGYMPLHINPVKRFSEETFESDNSLAGASDVTAKFAVLFPLINTTDREGHDETLPYADVTGGQSRAAGATSPDRSGWTLSDVYLVALTAEKKIDFSSAQMTGVDEIVVDHPGLDGDAVYYNLQGIRVMNPAKGQIYIVRQGAKTFKVLY